MRVCRGVALPIDSPIVTSGYGPRKASGFHAGVDLEAAEGTPVYAMLPGRVVLSEPSGALGGYGNVVVIRHAPDLYSLSAHLAYRTVDQGDELLAGAQLGGVGRTAGTRTDPGALFATSDPHLHLEFLPRWPPPGRGEGRLNPADVLARLGVIVPYRGRMEFTGCPEDLPRGRQQPRQTGDLGPKRRSGGNLGLVLLIAWALRRDS